MENTQNNIKIAEGLLDLSNVDLSTMSLSAFKSIKMQLHAQFDKELAEICDKLPNMYAVLLAHSHGFKPSQVRDVKNGRLRDSEILKALKQLVKTSPQNVQTLITVENE